MQHKTRGWQATESTDLVGSEYKLTVTGEVQVLKSNEEPHLAEGKPQGINPTELLLDLTVTSEGAIGGDIVLWKPVRFEKAISPHQYKTVGVRQDGAIHVVAVEQVLS